MNCGVHLLLIKMRGSVAGMTVTTGVRRAAHPAPYRALVHVGSWGAKAAVSQLLLQVLGKES